MIASGQPVNDFIDSAGRHVLLRQGVLGIKVLPSSLLRAKSVHSLKVLQGPCTCQLIGFC